MGPDLPGGRARPPTVELGVGAEGVVIRHLQ